MMQIQSNGKARADKIIEQAGAMPPNHSLALCKSLSTSIIISVGFFDESLRTLCTVGS